MWGVLVPVHELFDQRKRRICLMFGRCFSFNKIYSCFGFVFLIFVPSAWAITYKSNIIIDIFPFKLVCFCVSVSVDSRTIFFCFSFFVISLVRYFFSSGQEFFRFWICDRGAHNTCAYRECLCVMCIQVTVSLYIYVWCVYVYVYVYVCQFICVYMRCEFYVCFPIWI